jgi:hypothetical protein
MTDTGSDGGRRSRERLEAAFREGLRASEAESPSYEDVAGYVDGTLDAAARALFEERLAGDPQLQAEVRDLREVQDALAAERRRRFWRVAGVGLAAAAALVLAIQALRPRTEPTPSSAKGPHASPSVRAAWSLRDGGRTVTLAGGSVAGLEGLDPTLSAPVAEALATGRVAVPPEVAALRGTRGTLLGPEADRAAFGVRSPVGTRVRGDRPTFRWQAHPDARRYVVAVFDESLARVARSPAVRGTEWTADVPLRRGRTYLWQVTATTPSGAALAPAPPEPEARFRVLDEREAAELDRALAEAGDSLLARGVALARAGVTGEAEEALAALAAANPDVAVARALLDDLRRK